LFRQQCDADTAYRSLKSHAEITRYKPRLQLDTFIGVSYDLPT